MGCKISSVSSSSFFRALVFMNAFFLEGEGISVKRHTIRMPYHLRDMRRPPRADLPVQPLAQIQSGSHKLPAPALIPQTVIPEWVPGKGRVGHRRVADEAARGVRVHGEQERDEEVVGVPEGLEGLRADAVVRRRVHEQHADEHDVPGDATGLRIVDLDGGLGADLVFLDVEEAVVVCLGQRVRHDFVGVLGSRTHLT